MAALRLDSMAATLGAFPADLRSLVAGCAGAAAARCRVAPAEVAYLAFRAFGAVLGRRAQRYGRERVASLRAAGSGRPGLDRLCDEAIAERGTDRIPSWPVARLR